MQSPRILRWLHWIGYIATIIVALEAGTIGIFAYKDWRFRQNAIEDSRTWDGPIASRPASYADESASRLLARIPPLERLPDESVRLAVMPSFGQDWFAIALVPRSGKTVGTLIVAHRDTATPNGIKGWQAPEHFVVPQSDYARMVTELGQQVERWRGETNRWTDGTPLAFERKKEGRVVSGVGNSPAHYGKVAALIRDALAPHSRTIAALDKDWVIPGGS